MLKPLLLTAITLLCGPAWAGIDDARQAYERGHFTEALDAFRELATQEDRHAMYYLGLMAARGEGRKVDTEAARYWMTKSAEAGDPDGQNTLASWYCTGGIIDSNPAQCLHWYNTSAQAGNAIGKIKLGQEVLAKVTGTAEAGDIAAQLFLSTIYRDGMAGIPADGTKAEYWLQRAIAPREGEGDDGPFFRCYSRWIGTGAINPSPCIALAAKDAEAGDVSAMVVLTWLYAWNGKGAQPQPAKAFYWSQRAAATDTAIGYVTLGMAYLNGTGTPVNEPEAFGWFIKAAKAGEAGSQAMVAYLYQEGKGVTQDFAQSCRWAERSALQRYPGALQLLTWQYIRGQGKAVDLPRAYALAAWMPVSKDNHDRDETIAEVKSRMTVGQVREGEALVAKWTEHGYEPACTPADIDEEKGTR